MGRSSWCIEETLAAMEEMAAASSENLFQGFTTKLEDYLERQVKRT